MKKIVLALTFVLVGSFMLAGCSKDEILNHCLLYTSDAADEEDSVDLGGRRIINKKKKIKEEREDKTK